MSLSNPLIKPLIDHLHSDGRLRVWSMVITIFGDVVQPRGGVVAMSELHDILGALGVESGAVRTAMSRLAKEGWVTREKQGRHSFYKLSAAGLESFIPATEKIYRAEYSSVSHKTYLAIGPNLVGHARETQNGILCAMGGILLRNGVALFADLDQDICAKIEHADFMLVECASHNFPTWIGKRLDLAKLEENYAQMIERFAPLSQRPDAIAAFTPLQALCVRLLLIHEWRRLILKQPPLPNQLLPDDWPGLTCQKLVAQLYHQLLPISEAWWDEPAQKTAQAELARRFF